MIQTDEKAASRGGTINAEPEESETQNQLQDIENGSTVEAGQPSGGPEADRDRANRRNERYITSGHKSTDRKTGVAQAEEHYTWRQVYRLCEVEGYGHE